MSDKVNVQVSRLLQPKVAYNYTPKETAELMQKLRDEHEMNVRRDDHLETRTCAGCGEQFYANRNDGNYCCYEHSDGHWHGAPEGAGAERTASKQAAEDEFEGEDLAAIVMEYARRHREDIFVSDKEVPETFRDLRPAGQDIDPGDFLVSPYLSGSDQQKDAVNQSNYRVYIKRYGGVEGLHQIRGDIGSFGIAIRLSALSASMLDDLISLDTYPASDDEGVAQVEHEAIDEAWNDWARYDFIRALEAKFPDKAEMIDGLDEDQTRLVFDLVRKRIGIEWVQDSSAMFIDIVQIADAVTEGDIAPTHPIKEAALAEKGSPTRAPGVSSHNLFTADQVLRVYGRAGVGLDQLPRKGGQPLTFRMPGEGVTIRITRSDARSTYDKPLWLCEHLPGPATV